MAKEYKVFEGSQKEWESLANSWREGKTNPIISDFYAEYGRIPNKSLKQSSRKGEVKKYITRNTASLNKSSQNRKENTRGTNPEIDAQIERLDKQKAWPPGKSKKGFLRWQGSVYSEAQREANAWAWKHGYKTHAGHGRAAKLGGPNARTNLAPEGAAGNLSKQETGIERADWELDEAGISRSKTHAFQEYLMEGTSPKVRNVNDFSALTRRILVHNTDIPIDQAMSIAENELIQRGPQIRSESKVSQKNIRSLPETTHLLKDTVAHITKNAGKFTKVATGAGTAESVALIAGGQPVAGSIGLALQTPTVQKQIAKLMAKQGLKLIPGVSFGSGLLQAGGYLMSGQYGKAALSTVGGVAGEFGPAGDAVQAMIDLGLTVDDIKKPKTSNIDMTEDGKVSKYSTGVMHSPTGKGDAAFDYVVNKLKEDPTQFDSSGFAPTISTNELIKKAGKTTRKLLR